MKTFYFKQSLENESTKNGSIDGVAYSGEAIPSYNGFENFIVDLDSMKFSKKKIPLLRDHMTEMVVGHATVKLEDDQLSIKGIISKKTNAGKEIISLSEDDFDWELSIGVYEARLEEGFTGKVNGRDVENAFVLRDGLLREVSIVALGADRYTSANIFKQDIEETLKMNEKDFKKLVSKMGLSESAKIEDILAKLEISEEMEKAVEEKEAVIEVLEKTIEDLETQIAEIKEEEEVEEREEEIEAAVKEKGLSLGADQIKAIALTKESTELFKSTLSALSIDKKIDPKFTAKKEFVSEKPVTASIANLQERANDMVKKGEAKDFMSALAKLQEEI